MEPDGISDIEGKVARVATSKLGNERVSNSTSAHSARVFISVWLSQRRTGEHPENVRGWFRLLVETNFGFCFYPQMPFVPIRTDSEELNTKPGVRVLVNCGRQINQKEASSQTRRSENSGEINPCSSVGEIKAYSAAGFDFVAAVFRLRGRFRDFGAAPLRTARTLCSCSAADAARWRRSLRSLRSCFSCK